MSAFRTVICGVVAVVGWSGLAAAQAPNPGATTHPAVTLSSTEVRTLSSSILSRDFQIYVALPWSYRVTEKRYPAVYVTDADASFGMAHAAYQVSQNDQEIPELILVGIGYGLDISSALSTWNTRRTQELTPGAAKDYPGSGDAARFSRFVREELVPFIEKNYRTDPADRTLGGGSLGGLFAMYVMLQTPSAFQQYVAGSPSLWWNDRMMFSLESAYAAKQRNLPVTLFTSIGSAESSTSVEPWREFVRILQERQYEGFRLITATLPDVKHSTAAGLALFSGLKSVFGGWPVDAEFLDRYVGRFVLPGKEVVTITREGQQLWADWNGQRKLNLLARAPAKFSFATGQSELIADDKALLPLVGLEYIDFRGSGRGPVERITIHWNGKPVVATRQK